MKGSQEGEGSYLHSNRDRRSAEASLIDRPGSEIDHEEISFEEVGCT